MNSERQILSRLLEGCEEEYNPDKREDLDEAGFEANGKVYKCAFGRYSCDGEPISRDEYMAAKDGKGGGSSASPARGEDPYVGSYIVDKERIFVAKDKESGQYFIHDGSGRPDEGLMSEDELKELFNELEPKKEEPNKSDAPAKKEEPKSSTTVNDENLTNTFSTAGKLSDLMDDMRDDPDQLEEIERLNDLAKETLGDGDLRYVTEDSVDLSDFRELEGYMSNHTKTNDKVGINTTGYTNGVSTLDSGAKVLWNNQFGYMTYVYKMPQGGSTEPKKKSLSNKVGDVSLSSTPVKKASSGPGVSYTMPKDYTKDSFIKDMEAAGCKEEDGWYVHPDTDFAFEFSVDDDGNPRVYTER